VPTLPAASDVRATAIRFLELVSTTLPCGVVVFDDARRVLFANEAFEALFGLPPGEVVGTRRDVLLARLLASFAEPHAAVAVCAPPPSSESVVTGDLALHGPGRRVVRWTTSQMSLDGVPVQVATCYELGALAGSSQAKS